MSPDPLVHPQPSEEAKLPDSDDLAEYVVATWITTTNGPKGDRMTFFPAVRAQLVSLVAIAMREVSAQALERAAKAICWACQSDKWEPAAQGLDHRNKLVWQHYPKVGTKKPPLMQWASCKAAPIRDLGGK